MKNHYHSVSKQISIISITLCMFLIQSVLHAQIQEGNFNFDGRNRRYMVFLPKDYTDTSNLPLVIYLHSYGWSAYQDKDYSKLYEVADTAGFIITYPSGIPNWNSGIYENSRWFTPDVDDVGFINALIDTLDNHYNIDLEKVYACGYSNGGFMAYKLGCQLNNRIAAIASVSGVLSVNTSGSCNATTATHPMPVIHFHGTTDYYVPYDGNTGWLPVDQTIQHWVNFNNSRNMDSSTLPDLDTQDNCTVERIRFINTSTNYEVIFYKIYNGGHTWPGAGLPGYANEGNVTGDINANVEMWNFFKKYTLDGPDTTLVSSIPKQSKNKTVLYPNPASDVCYLKSISNNKNSIINIYNLMGKKVKTFRADSKNNNLIQVQDLPEGVYIYKIQADYKYVSAGKLIIQRH